MENQEYLNQIAAKSAPVQVPKGKSSKFDLQAILHSKIFLVISIGLVVLIFLAIVGSMLSGNKKDIKTEIVKLKLHIDSTSEVINDYQPNVKSSILRSYSASFNSVLTITSSDLADYLTTKYDYKSSKDDKKLTESAAKQQEELSNELFEAKINGNLDRIYAHEMAYEIEKIEKEEEAIYDATKDETLKAVLDQSYNSLETLYNNFNEFSETNN